MNTLTAPERRSSALLLSAPNDNLSIESLRQVSRYLSEQVQMAVTTGERHGTELLGASGSNALSTAIEWLDARTPTNLTPDEIEALVAAGDPNNGETLFAEGRPDLPLEEGTPCTHCHHADSEERDIGPGLLNISQYATNRVDGQSAAVYLYESIVAPDRYLVEGFSDSIMPPRYDKGFTEEQIGDLVAYLLSLES